MGKFGPNYQYLLFQVKLDTLTNSIMQNSMAVFTFFFFNQKRFFFDKFGRKCQNCEFKAKFGS